MTLNGPPALPLTLTFPWPIEFSSCSAVCRVAPVVVLFVIVAVLWPPNVSLKVAPLTVTLCTSSPFWPLEFWYQNGADE